MLFAQEKDPYLGIVLNVYETLFDFLKLVCGRLAGRLLPYAPVTAPRWVMTKLVPKPRFPYALYSKCPLVETCVMFLMFLS